MRPSRLLPIALVLALSSSAYADRRAFTQTYEYLTMPEGGVELEIHNTQSRQTWDSGSPSAMAFQLETEYGITDHWDIALYQGFAETSGTATGMPLPQPFHYDYTSIETRYRFGTRGQYPVDPELYLEVAKDFGHNDYEVEGKVILSKDIGAVTVAANLIGELELGVGKETEFEPGWAAGASYEASPRWKLGAETFGHVDLEAKSTAASVGPAVSWAPSSHLWIATTAGFGLTDDAPRFQVSTIIGLGIY